MVTTHSSNSLILKAAASLNKSIKAHAYYAIYSGFKVKSKAQFIANVVSNKISLPAWFGQPESKKQKLEDAHSFWDCKFTSRSSVPRRNTATVLSARLPKSLANSPGLSSFSPSLTMHSASRKLTTPGRSMVDIRLCTAKVSPTSSTSASTPTPTTTSTATAPTSSRIASLQG